MFFHKLSIYFDKLEATSSRLELINILAELFKQTKKEDIAKIIYLLQGRVAPFFEPIEFGMADKTISQAIALAYDVDKEQVWKLYQKEGDMGLVPAKLSKILQLRSGQKIKVEEVFETLMQIAKTSGEGTVEKRVNLLKSLLVQLDSISVKHLVRIALGNMRLGIGDPTVLDGLALAILGDRSQRKLLEKAYNETSDLGLIGETLLKEGLKGLAGLEVTVGRPIRSELCERLPNPEKVFEKMDAPSGASLRGAPVGAPLRGVSNGGVQATPKYDGFRVQIHKDGDKVEMFSRNLEDMTHMFPELIEGTLKQVKAKTAILDSEALAYQPESEEFLPFQETTKRRRKHNIAEVAKQLPLKAFVFDILYVNGNSLIDTPLLERMEILKKTVTGDEILIPAPGKVLHKPEELQLMLDDSISKGLEGVVVKRIDSPYEAGGRNFNWVKLKRHSSGELNDTIDCVVLGYIFGKGKRTAFGAGALLVGLYDKDKDEFVTVSRIGTGLTDEEWISIKSRTKNLERKVKPARVNSLIEPSVWVEPAIVIEVLADEITRSPMHTAGMGEESPLRQGFAGQAKSQRVKESAPIESGSEVKEAGYALRFPRLISFRDKDKKAEDATTVEELVKMYKQQSPASNSRTQKNK